MKILHFITSLKFGGAESALCNYLAEVVLDKHDQHFVAYLHDGPNVVRVKSLGVPVFKLSGRFFCYSLLTFIRLKKLIQTIKPDVLHSSLWSANIISRILTKFIGIPLVCDLHGSSSDEGRLRNIFDQATALIPSKIIAVSDSVKDSYLKNIVSTIKNDSAKKNVKQNLIVIKNGIDFEKLRAKAFCCKLQRSVFGLADDDFVVGAVGRLEAIKSYDVLIKAFAKFCEHNKEKCFKLKLMIVGTGSQIDRLQQLSKDLNLSKNIIFAGFWADAYCFYPLFNCFALSSKSEGLSISLLEALSFGLPVISTHREKAHDVIEDGQNGFLIKPGDIAGYAESLNLLYSSPELCNQISACNLKLVASEFSIQKVVNDYKKIYKNVLN